MEKFPREQSGARSHLGKPVVPGVAPWCAPGATGWHLEGNHPEGGKGAAGGILQFAR